MTQQEFNRITLFGSEKEATKAILEHPKFAAECASRIEKELRESPLTMDGMDYQRLVDRGLEDVESYDYMSDV